MIKFALVCQGGHEFESWFQNGSAFDAQLHAKLLECPHCQSIQISKAIMAPAVSKGRAKSDAAPLELIPDARGTAEPSLPIPQEPATPPLPVGGPLLDDQSRQLREMVAAFHRKIQSDAVDVGSDFAEEARRIHDGKAEQRLIFGQATFQDAKALLEEGISIMPLPPLPEDFN